MPGRNLAKPFAIAGFILAEIYMLFTVLGHYGHESDPLPAPPLAEVAGAPAKGTPPPLKAQITRVVICAVFFGPFGALVGTGMGLLVSGIRGDFRQTGSSSPAPQPPGASSPPR